MVAPIYTNRKTTKLGSCIGLLESIQGTDIVLGSTEPANYRGSYTTASKEIVDIEITMYQTAGTIVMTAVKLLLLKLRISDEQEGGLRN
jgi:hypothetical protein